MAKKKILKQKSRPKRQIQQKQQSSDGKQQQSQGVSVIIDNSRRTTRRTNPNPQPRQPQIIPIPYPIMQQQPIQQQQFNRPVPQVPQANNNQVFENNFNRLNERLNNLAENFNNHAQNIMGRLNAQQQPQTPQTPATPPTVELPKPQERRPEKVIVLDDEPTPQVRQPNQTPIIQGTRDLISTAKSAKIFSPVNDGIPYEVNMKVELPPSRLFLSPNVNMNPNGFNKPKQVHTTGKEFNQPILQLDFKSPPPATANEQFNQKLEETEKKDIVEAEEEPKKKFNIGEYKKEQAKQRREEDPTISKMEDINKELRQVKNDLKRVEEELNQKGDTDTKLIREERDLRIKEAELVLKKNYDEDPTELKSDYEDLLATLKEEQTKNKNLSDSMRRQVNKFIALNGEKGVSKITAENAIKKLESVKVMVSRLSQQKAPPQQGVTRQFGANIKTMSDINTNQSMSTKGGQTIPI